MLRFSSKFLPLAWILIGAMVGGSLFDYLASKQTAGVCVELRILEQEDDRADLTDVFFVATDSTWCLNSLRSSEELIESPKPDFWRVHQAARSERGPPSLVVNVA